jgi:RND family efflux transporter MFP subunit
MTKFSARLTAACSLLAMSMLCALAQAQMPPAAVVVDTARLESAEQYREVVGELRALRRALLAAEEEGLVVEFDLREGDAVAAGQVIARLRDLRAEMEVRRAQADLAARRASLAERTADLERARRDLTRIDELSLRGSAAQSELEDRRTAVSVAEARRDFADAEIASADAALSLAQDHLERRIVKAPFAGFVVARRTEVGQWVRQGDPVLELIALDRVEARLNVPEAFIANLQSSAGAVRIRIQATGEILNAPVAAIIPEADPLSRLFPVRLELENTANRLRPGMSIVGLIAAGKHEPTLTIHKDAILRDDAGEFVFFSAGPEGGAGGPAGVARIQTLFPLGQRVAVRSSTLRPGMAIVVEGNERLAPGQPLNITATRPGPAGANDAAPDAQSPGAPAEGQRR